MTDDQAVTRLEAFVQKQVRPQPWTPITDYSLLARIQAEGKHPEIIHEVFEPKRVLDAGCGPGHLVRMLVNLGIEAYGVDDQVWADWLDAPRFAKASLEALDRSPFGGRFDVVICREVLEHLTVRQLRAAVTHLVRLSSRYVYVTTRFARAPDHVLAVDGSDDLDPTHITLLTKPFLRALFVLEGCSSRPDLETRLDWQQKGRCLVVEVPS